MDYCQRQAWARVPLLRRFLILGLRSLLDRVFEKAARRQFDLESQLAREVAQTCARELRASDRLVQVTVSLGVTSLVTGKIGPEPSRDWMRLFMKPGGQVATVACKNEPSLLAGLTGLVPFPPEAGLS